MWNKTRILLCAGILAVALLAVAGCSSQTSEPTSAAQVLGHQWSAADIAAMNAAHLKDAKGPGAPPPAGPPPNVASKPTAAPATTQ